MPKPYMRRPWSMWYIQMPEVYRGDREFTYVGLWVPFFVDPGAVSGASNPRHMGRSWKQATQEKKEDKERNERNDT